MSVDLAKIRALLAAATPGPWYPGIELADAMGNYWCPTDVYALAADPWSLRFAYPEDGESVCEQWSAWDDEHGIGTVAATHNYYPIPDNQHDANNRFIANAPEWLAALCQESDTLRERCAALEDQAYYRDEELSVRNYRVAELEGQVYELESAKRRLEDDLYDANERARRAEHEAARSERGGW